jgi:lipopolysaccharide/colanic/teichoic acid biosynthesis glycosyltransferase
MRRIIDALIAAIVLIIASPLMLAIAFLIKREDGGPAFYRGRRVGRGGIPFFIFKFRSMVSNAEHLGGTATSDDDMRITSVGRFLRKYKLDELPNMINIVAGDMNLVGPRPEVQKFVDMYTDREREILAVRPGITDWASLWNSDEGAFLAGSPDPERTYAELLRPTKLKLQLIYVQERSLWTDAKILFYTARKLVDKQFVPPELASYSQPNRQVLSSHYTN